MQVNLKSLVSKLNDTCRATLEAVLNTPGLQELPCYLASWGYLKPNDTKDLPSKINLLTPENLMSPLANWP